MYLNVAYFRVILSLNDGILQIQCIHQQYPYTQNFQSSFELPLAFLCLLDRIPHMKNPHLDQLPLSCPQILACHVVVLYRDDFCRWVHHF